MPLSSQLNTIKRLTKHPLLPIIGLLLLFGACYVALAWFASQDATRTLFDSIHGYRVFDIDDTYRRYLASLSFSTGSLWVWNYYLPGNFLFDGFFSWATGHHEFLMRLPHLAVNLLGIALLYRAGLKLNIAKGWLLLSLTLLLCMPLYALVSLSFYGESLLAAIVCISIYAVVCERHKLATASLALMPFIRPEGVFYLGFYAAKQLWKKRFTRVIALLLPSFIYFVIILVVFNFSLSAYWQDRSAFGVIYGVVNPDTIDWQQVWLPYITLNPLWWITGIIGGLLPITKKLRPFLLGSLLLMAHWLQQTLEGHANGEARYYMSFFPLFALYQAALLHSIASLVASRWRKLTVIGATVVMLAIGIENMLQLDPLRNSYFSGHRYPIGQQTTQATSFATMPPEYQLALEQAYAFTCAYSDYDKSVDKIIVNAFQWFNKPKVCDLPKKVSVELSFLNSKTVYSLLNGYFYTLYPELPHYSFYQFKPSDTPNALNKALYITFTKSQLNPLPPLFTNGIFSIHLVTYQSTPNTPFFSATH